MTVGFIVKIGTGSYHPFCNCSRPSSSGQFSNSFQVSFCPRFHTEPYGTPPISNQERAFPGYFQDISRIFPGYFQDISMESHQTQRFSAPLQALWANSSNWSRFGGHGGSWHVATCHYTSTCPSVKNREWVNGQFVDCQMIYRWFAC